jgi:beta-lactamase regulating signal transducer with metallopeptidase domain
LELALRSSVILIAAWLLVRLAPRATAATRHLIWHTALLASLLVPLASLAQLPRVPIVPIVPHVLVPQVLEPQRPGPTATQDASIDSSNTAAFRTEALHTASALATLGTFVIALWFLAGWVAAARLSRRTTPAPVAWQLELNALCGRLRIAREVRLGVLDQPGSPLATGLSHAMILLPPTAAAWTADRRAAVLLHELAHIKRQDCRVQLVAHAACALYWFNPLVWMAAKALRSERERACDDEVLRLGAQASSYAAHLLDIARDLRPNLRPSAALAMARPSELEGRLLAVLTAGRARVPWRGTRWAVITTLSLVTGAALGATSIAPHAKTAAPTLDSGSQYIVANEVAASAEPAPQPLAKAKAALQASKDPQDRERATLALAFASGRDVIPALLQALGDPEPQVREKAAIGLALRRDERVVGPLIAAMADPDSQVREKAAIALGTSGDLRAQDALKRALNDPDPQVREKAAAGLVLFGLTR